MSASREEDLSVLGKAINGFQDVINEEHQKLIKAYWEQLYDKTGGPKPSHALSEIYKNVKDAERYLKELEEEVNGIIHFAEEIPSTWEGERIIRTPSIVKAAWLEWVDDKPKSTLQAILCQPSCFHNNDSVKNALDELVEAVKGYITKALDQIHSQVAEPKTQQHLIGVDISKITFIRADCTGNKENDSATANGVEQTTGRSRALSSPARF